GRERPKAVTLPPGAGSASPGRRQASDARRKTLRPGSCREGGRPVPGRSRRVFDMRIKRFTAPDMRTALRMVRDEQGPDAVILSTRTSADGVGIEVVAATDYDEALVAQALRAAAPAVDEAAARPHSGGASTQAPQARGAASADTTSAAAPSAGTQPAPRETLMSRARAVFRIGEGPTLAELTSTQAPVEAPAAAATQDRAQA